MLSNLCELTLTQASKWESLEKSQLSWPFQSSPVGARTETLLSCAPSQASLTECLCCFYSDLLSSLSAHALCSAS